MSTLEVLTGDCCELIPTITSPIDLVFADPPFNIGQSYDEYVDKNPKFVNLIEDFICASMNVLRPGGILSLHGPDELTIRYLEYCGKQKYKRLAWVNWHYRFGQCNDSNWIDSRCHLLIYRKDGAVHTWNPDDVLVESDRSSKYGDKRIGKSSRGGKRVPFTVWGIPSDGQFWGRVQGNSQERCKNMPNQLPEVYMERIIRAYTNIGNTVLDPFGGSGTTAAVCKALGRNCITIDVSKKSCEAIRDRWERGAVRVKNVEKS